MKSKRMSRNESKNQLGMLKILLFLIVIFAMIGIVMVVSAQVPPPQNDVLVEVTPAQQTGMPGEMLTYNVTLINNGTVPDIIVVDSITEIPDGWGVELKDDEKTVPLPYSTPLLQSNTSYNLSLDVHIPITATSTTESMTIEIYSYADFTKRDNATFCCIVNNVPFNINIISPENRTYANTCVRLNFTVEPEGTVLDWIGYSLDGGANVTITENMTVSGLSACGHDIVVYARDTHSNMATSNMVYFILHPGDIYDQPDQPGKVNVFDLQRLAWAFNSYPTHPNWNRDADLNCDNKVNVFDLQILAWNFENDYKVICGA